MGRQSGAAFSRVAVVNRGEPTIRLINAVREWNAEGRQPLRVIALYAAADRRATFVRAADEALMIGPDPDSGEDTGALSASPYLDFAELERALVKCRADAVWPGWGFASEKAELAELCDRLGIIFIGPPAEVMRRLSDKIESKRLAERAGVPLAACSGPVTSLAEARAQAKSIGYPLMIEATAGDGGHGTRLVGSPDDLDEAFERATSEASKSAGDPTVFLERAISGGRHVEVQVVADAAGTVWTLGVRDCSVRRRDQKVIEESASTALDAEQERRLRVHAAELMRAAGYAGAGTVGFHYQPDERLLSFLEVSPRLQVEHPVSEVTTGVDIVKLQLHIAAGGTLAEIAAADPPTLGHAIEVRLTAEDPERGFAPAPGLIEYLALPAGPGIRVDAAVAERDVISPQADSMIAKVIAAGRDRCEARARLSRALRQTATVIRGGTTNKAFLLDLLDRPEFVSGEFDATWLDTMIAGGYRPPRRVDVALLAAAFDAYEAHESRQQAHLFASAARGRPEIGHETWHQLDVRADGEAYRLRVARPRLHRYHVELDGLAVEADIERSGRFELTLGVGGQAFHVLCVAQGADYLIEVDGAVHRISRYEAGLVRAQAPAMVVAIPVQAGDEVAEGDVVAVVESMKLETALRAPVAGRVTEVIADVNTQVESGAKLVRIEQDPERGPAWAHSTQEIQGSATRDGGGRASLAALADPANTDRDPAALAADALAALRCLVLGFDVDEEEVARQVRRLDAARAGLPADDRRVLAAEISVLQIFADLCALWRNRRVCGDPGGSGDIDAGGEPAADAEGAHNAQEYLHAFLRSCDADAEGLPGSFRMRLRRTLAHYGITDLEPSLDLGPALYRIFLAHRRAAAHVPVVSELLQWRLRHPGSLSGEVRDGYRRVVEQLVEATELRYPAVGDLARQVRYCCFEASLIVAERVRAQQQVRAELDRLSADPETRAAQIDAIVATGEPILGVFTERHHPVMLEVMTRRYYRIRPLAHVQLTQRNGHPVLMAEYVHDGQRYLVIATVADAGEIAPATDLAQLLDTMPSDRTVLIDLYHAAPRTPEDDGTGPDGTANWIRDKLGTIPSGLGRVSVAVCPADDAGRSSPTWFTFRSAPRTGAAVEDRTLRGMHPLVAERLGLWRLSGFELTRLPAAPDVHLFRARGHQVPADQRLIALADVRDLTVMRDRDGRIRGLPQLDRALDACLDSLRSVRSADREAARLDWNRVMLHVWPVTDISITELHQVMRSLAPRTEALGLEQVLTRLRVVARGSAEPREVMLRMSWPPGTGLTLRVTDPPSQPLRELDSYTQSVIRARRRGAVYPYELIPLITRSPDRDGTAGTFTEYDLDPAGAPVPVDRAPGSNVANLVLGVVSTPTRRYPEGMRRVVLLGDPTRALGAIAEPECRRVLAAIDLARRLDAPVEWFALSSGAKIAMDSGTETMDWISRVLRAIIEFTQGGGEINVVVAGINVGAQPYWNAEATMLMHTKGILIMTPDSAMVLTGKQSLDYSGGVSAEDNFGIGGYDRIMGRNGQAQYWAPDLSTAADVLLAHYEHTYTAPGERFPRPAPTTDPAERDISAAPHAGPADEFSTLGEIFDPVSNPGRKKPFDVRSLLRGVVDADHEPLERWADMGDAESAVVVDAHLGGQPVALIGFESRPLPRHGPYPVDGPSRWTAGTLFPRSSKKTARAINAASGNRPLVILANLSGFDGSPESLRQLQLEYGAEIGRAVVNFDGPIVFCVVSRYHGGAFVVFSGTLNDNMEVAAVEGSYASVIGGAPAAAVVFAGEVRKRTAADPRVAGPQAAIAEASASGDHDKASRLRAELDAAWPAVHAEKLGQIADEFDSQHSIQRAQSVGSVQAIIPAAGLRPYLIEAVRRGMRRTMAAPGKSEQGSS
jgi:acetyl/propionyl-CoA carboxylase alpha subunit/acetyl-CoA carboxylase carboxyltransferase component